MFNRPLFLFDTETIIPIPPASMITSEIKKWQQHQKEVLETFYPMLAQKIIAKQQGQQQRFAKNHITDDTLLPIGTIVNIRDELRRSKNEHPYIGKYLITEITPQRTYILKDQTIDEYSSGTVTQTLSHVHRKCS